ncbi:MAG TPA: DNA-3-methyladenine glycosylase [Polyangiaceae bacterium]|nr:DNA-3-methyladenine glycosylase [Polyangiaceae bacterium]
MPLQPLPRAFYARPVLTVAREVIGKLLVHESSQGLLVGRIVEAEAYRGPEDRAAHSWGGRRTPRTEVMYGEPGLAYVFFVYGMHWHLNLVTTRAGAPHAVLLRAIEPLQGADLMAHRRGVPASHVNLSNGPGKLCQALGVDRRHYGLDLTAGSELFLSEGPGVARGRLGRSPRIGVDYAEDWAEKPWRFFERDNRWVSRVRRSGRGAI